MDLQATALSERSLELLAELEPHAVFVHFLKFVGCDSAVLLDFLVSNETCFLQYLVKCVMLLLPHTASVVSVLSVLFSCAKCGTSLTRATGRFRSDACAEMLK